MLPIKKQLSFLPWGTSSEHWHRSYCFQFVAFSDQQCDMLTTEIAALPRPVVLWLCSSALTYKNATNLLLRFRKSREVLTAR